ncbi:endonuclease [Alcaligenes phage vB_Af_QDWS595]|uniref:Endonuclease n=1 Tax=Alcaligenes phage vB_Af_QDWS595 TaxID=2877946 RepID=A0AAE8Y1K4_9CAUD|nr:endonuclease [Alcaligenes phage vB_Af_QDWS595]UCR75497.1 endonuclease [Alcaligenes phage vB_Af_QDWS595]
MRELPKDFAEEIYIQDYIIKPKYDKVFDLSPAVAHKLIDAGVNTGTGRSSRWFQESLNGLNRGGKDYANIVVDGSVGSGTLNAYAKLQQVRGKVLACQMVIKIVDAKQANHYLSLTNLKEFTPGWISHRIGNVPISKCEDEK